MCARGWRNARWRPSDCACACSLKMRASTSASIRLPVPMRSSRVFLKLLELDLEKHPPAAPVVKVYACRRAGEAAHHAERIIHSACAGAGKAGADAGAHCGGGGEENVGSPELVDTHRPGAFRMRPFGVGPETDRQECLAYALAFRAFRPPLAAKVQAELHLRAGHSRQRFPAGGPWRTSGDWWSTGPWARDEWDIELADGALYRIYCDAQTGRWFVEGSYD